MLQVSRAANFPMASVMSITLMLVIVVVYAITAKHLKMTRV
jgi:ABC-type spermidine/putrescine transport system permease subunit I